MPTAPRNLTLVMNMDDVELNWLPPLTPNGAVTYTVQRTDGGDSTVNETETTGTSYPLTNQPPSTGFSFTVEASTTNGTSPESNSVFFCNDTGECAPSYSKLIDKQAWIHKSELIYCMYMCV